MDEIVIASTEDLRKLIESMPDNRLTAISLVWVHWIPQWHIRGRF